MYIFAIGQCYSQQIDTAIRNAYERWNICFPCWTWDGINGYTKQDVAVAKEADKFES